MEHRHGSQGRKKIMIDALEIWRILKVTWEMRTNESVLQEIGVE